MFKTAFNRGETTFSECGSETAPTYGYRIDKKTGKRILEKTGETNIYEKIQANLESTKIENIVKKFMAGDVNALNQREGAFLDLTDIPTNLLELQNTILKAKQEFDTLPAEIRKKFDNSAEKFVSEYGTEKWLEAMGYDKKLDALHKDIIESVNAAEKEETSNE